MFLSVTVTVTVAVTVTVSVFVTVSVSFCVCGLVELHSEKAVPKSRSWTLCEAVFSRFGSMLQKSDLSCHNSARSSSVGWTR